MREKVYLDDVTKTLKEMRTQFLGHNENLSVLLPEHLKCAPSKEKAAYITHRLVFCLSLAADERDTEALQRCYKWLYSIILYLFEQCPSEDHIFGNIAVISDMRFEVRMVMFESDKYEILGTEAYQPYLMKGYDLAVLYLLNAVHRIKANERRFMYTKKKFYNNLL